MFEIHDKVSVEVSSVHPYGVYFKDKNLNFHFAHISDHLEELKDSSFSDYFQVGDIVEVQIIRILPYDPLSSELVYVVKADCQKRWWK